MKLPTVQCTADLQRHTTGCGSDQDHHPDQPSVLCDPGPMWTGREASAWSEEARQGREVLLSHARGETGERNPERLRARGRRRIDPQGHRKLHRSRYGEDVTYFTTRRGCGLIAEMCGKKCYAFWGHSTMFDFKMVKPRKLKHE